MLARKIKKISELTEKQKSMLPHYAEKGLAIGLSTEDNINKKKAIEAIKEVYRCGGIEPPQLYIFTESPLHNAVLYSLLKNDLVKDSVNDSVWASVNDSACDSVWASVNDSVWNLVGSSVRNSTVTLVRDTVRRSVVDSIWDSVWGSVRDSVVDSVRNSVWASVRDSVRNSVGDSVGDSVWDSVRNSVRDSVVDSVVDSVEDSVGDSVWDSVSDSVSASVWASVRASVRALVVDSVKDSVRNSVWVSVRDSVWDSVWDSVKDSVWASVKDSVWDSVRDSVWASVRDSVVDSVVDSIGSSCYGLHDANWLVFFDFFHSECGINCSQLQGLWDASLVCGWFIPYKNLCIISPKPKQLSLIENNNGVKVLHGDGKPAIYYCDDFKVYALNGVRVPEYLAMTPAENLDVDFLLKEKNADIKAEFIRKYGIDRMISLGVEKDTYTNYDNEWWTRSEYKLIDMSKIFSNINYAPYLYMKNQTIGTYHLEGVDPSCTTIGEAIQCRWGKNINNYKTVSIS